MKTTLFVAGIFAVIIGIVWTGQGTGYFPYPQSSFMISQIKWAYCGATLGVVGLVMMMLSRRA